MFLCCVLVNLNRMGLLGVDLFFFSFWFLFRNLSFIVTFHLNLHSFLGSSFRCFKRVFVLEMVLSIKMRRELGLLDWHSQFLLFSPFMISFLFEICPVRVSSTLLCNLFAEC